MVYSQRLGFFLKDLYFKSLSNKPSQEMKLTFIIFICNSYKTRDSKYNLEFSCKYLGENSKTQDY